MSSLIDSEKFYRQKIYDEIMAIDLSEGKEISSDWYAASLRVRLVCAFVAKGGFNDLDKNR